MKLTKLLITPLLIPLILSSCGKTTTPNTQSQNSPDQSQIIQYYKDAINQLQDELITAKEEAYILTAGYEIKIRELEEYISSIENKNDGSTENPPSQNINTQNHKANFEYEITSSGVTIKKYIGKSENIEIPSSIDGHQVTKIQEYAFSETKIKSVVLPKTLNELDWFSFYKCPFLEKIYIPESVTNIGYGAFDLCSQNLTIFGAEGSYAERYANSFGIKFTGQ